MGYNYEDSVTMGFHCTGRDFDLSIAIALTSFASLPMFMVSIVVGPLIEIPVMLTLGWLALPRRGKIRLKRDYRIGSCVHLGSNA